MYETLSLEQLDEITRMVSEHAAGITPYSDETNCLVWAALPALIAMARQALQSDDVLSLTDSGIGHYRERMEKAKSDLTELRLQILSDEGQYIEETRKLNERIKVLEGQKADLESRLAETWEIAKRSQRLAIRTANVILEGNDRL